MATIGLIGTGKTGGKVKEVAEGHTVIGFNQANPPTSERLRNCDVVIVFVPGEAFEKHIELLIESGKPVVTGATGVTWPDGVHERLLEQGTTWVSASNFSRGMNVVQAMIEKLATASQLFPEAVFSIHEVHHTQKVDAPSGTALSWREWLGSDASISSERVGDVVGEHTMTLDTEFEQIKLHHSAKDRRIFASGAVWAAEWILRENRSPGLHAFEDIVRKELEVQEETT